MTSPQSPTNRPGPYPAIFLWIFILSLLLILTGRFPFRTNQSELQIISGRALFYPDRTIGTVNKK